MDLDRELYQFFHNFETQNNQTFIDFLESVPDTDHEKLQNLAYRIPFPEYNQILLNFLEEKNLVIFTQIALKHSVSTFIPVDQIKSLIGDTRFPNISEQELFEKLMRDIFVREGRIPNHEHLMGHYPLYLEKHIEVMKIVFDYDLSISSV